MQHLLGLDIGSSSVKASLVNGANGKTVSSAFYPEKEMTIDVPRAGWAEQDPESWWTNAILAIRQVLSDRSVDPGSIRAIGISYQMHGLVLIDRHKQVLRPSIIWCDSRAVAIGNKAFEEIGKEQCLSTTLNSPGNFTASKLKWVKENEPGVYENIDTIMLPGDYIAMRLTGEVCTTASGLSEGVFWDFKNNQLSERVMDYFQFDTGLIPELVPTFAVQGRLLPEVAEATGLKAGTPVTYRAGDQPNNALSLNVLRPGEIAATAGTSGVVYGIIDQVTYDPQSRVNTFMHVNHSQEEKRMGVLLCINGAGILNAWLKRMTGASSYETMNEQAGGVPVGSEGLSVYPFGNGAERMLGNKQAGGMFSQLDFNVHQQGHLYRAAQEGIVFSFAYGMNIMKETGLHPVTIKAGKANMFLSGIFRETLTNVTQIPVELYDTDGAKGAALGAGYGSGFYGSLDEAFAHLTRLQRVEPGPDPGEYEQAYQHWLAGLHKIIPD